MEAEGHFADAIRRLRQEIDKASRIVAFTGAGISTESGISDFRSPGGIWERYQPVEFSDFEADIRCRRKHWRYKEAFWAEFGAALPNAGHHALRRLYERAKLKAVVTQNVDGLHVASGMPAEAVIELHGSSLFIECVGAVNGVCAWRMGAREFFAAFEPGTDWPGCPFCGAPTKPATVMFGQLMPEGAMERASELLRSADLVLSIGTSLVVNPAAMLVGAAHDAGVPLVILNRDPTPYDRFATLVVGGSIGEALGAVVP